MFKTALIRLLAVVTSVHCHGRLMTPASRSSLWRRPEFQSLNPPINVDDDELWCANVHQINHPGTNCGVCGDPIDEPVPRANEIGGKMYRGIITGRYVAGQIIDVVAEVVPPHHYGFWEVRLCDNPGNGMGETQSCFNQHLLQRADGNGSRVEVNRSGWFDMRFRLPAGVRCDRCVIQWLYRGGDEKEGSQEFRGCADVTIA